MTMNKFCSYLAAFALWAWGLALGFLVIANVPALQAEGPVVSVFVVVWVSVITLMANNFFDKLYARLCIL